MRRVVQNMTEDELTAMETAYPTYALKIKDKISALQAAHREKTFYKWLDSGKICCQEAYSFPEVITPADANSSVPLSLYEAECEDLNNAETKLRDLLASCEAVEWWH